MTTITLTVSDGILSSAIFTNGIFSMSINGQRDLSYVVETSTNLATWLPVWTNSSALPPLIFTDGTSNLNQRFYHVRLGP